VIDSDTLEREAPTVARAEVLTWQQALVGYLPPHYRAWGKRNVHHLPLALVLVVFSFMTLRLNNTAFIDEALYINAGYDYLAYWFADGPYVDHARYFSGHPMFYPVFAAFLDGIGGLRLVRAFSWLLMVVAIVVTARTTTHFFGYRAGMFAGAALALVGPVMYVGHHATYDALAVALLVFAAALATTRQSLLSATGVAALLAVATVAKYAAGVFIPVVLALMLFVGTRPVVRASIATATLAVVGGAWYLTASEEVLAGIRFTTTSREALSPTTTGVLVTVLLVSLGAVLLLASVGGYFAATSWRSSLAVLTLLGAALLLPAGQLILSELLAFEKHLAYSAVFLAPLAGLALDRFSRGTFAFLPALLIGVLLISIGDVRSRGLIEYGDVTPVLKEIGSEQALSSGIYLSSHADPLAYHTRDNQDLTWVTTFSLYPQGEEEIRNAVAQGAFERIILHGGDTTGNPDQDLGEQILVSELADTPEYELTRTDGDWRIFTLTAPPAGADGAAAQQLEEDLEDLATAPAAPGGAPTEDTSEESTSEESTDPRADLHQEIARGDRGATVAQWQAYLIDQNEDALPEYGVDGLYGEETEAWTERYLETR
jgi:hypothetical protein